MFDVQQIEQKKVFEFIKKQSSALLVIMFADIVDSSKIADKYGDIIGDEIRNSFETIVSQIIPESGNAMIVKFLGDGVLSVFIEPVSAIEKSIVIQKIIKEYNQNKANNHPNLSLRIGLHLGQVTVENRFQTDFFGFHVNKAARVMAHCPPGSIVMTYAIFDSAYPRLKQNTEYHWTCLGERSLKGFKEREKIYQITTDSVADTKTIKINPDQFIGETIGNYKIKQFIGVGGYGTVFVAEHAKLKKEVAVKITHPVSIEDVDLRKPFDKGARVQASLKHPYIAELYDYGEYFINGEPRLVLIMEYINGKSLSGFIGQIDSKSSLKKFLTICSKVCEAVHYAHNVSYYDDTGFEIKGVCHGDIKPGNILIDKENNPKIIDFMMLDYQRLFDLEIEIVNDKKSDNKSLSLNTGCYGTLGFMAPEQENKGLVSPKSDVFSMGRTICSILLGIDNANIDTEMLMNKIRTSPKLFPKKLVNIIDKSMDNEPNNRYLSMAELQKDLDSTYSFWGKYFSIGR